MLACEFWVGRAETNVCADYGSSIHSQFLGTFSFTDLIAACLCSD